MSTATRTRSKRAAAPVLSEADREAMDLVCRNEAHHPFNLNFVDAPGGMTFPHAFVRTTSWEWDGCGGRTDLHEIFGLLWAMLLRARGVASAGFFDDGGFGNPTEIYSRALVFAQPFDQFFKTADVHRRELLAAHSAAAAHDLYGALSLKPVEEQAPEWQEKSIPWLEDVRSHLGCEDDGELFVERLNPDWRYYTAPGSHLTALELPPGNMVLLRHACRFFQPSTHRQGNRLILSAGGLRNAVAIDALRKAERMLQALDKSPFTKIGDGRGRWDSPSAMVIPMENRLVVLGGHFLISVASLCGYRQFLTARDRWEEKNREAAIVFGQVGTFDWREPVDSNRFTELAEALLRVEPGVIRVRSSGPHNERDQGRDIIVDRPAVALDQQHAATRIQRETVQVKVRNRTIGKQDVRDIRDTLEYHDSSGYLLIAYPRISGDLVTHLEQLEAKGLTVDWWTRAQLEERLRRHPAVLAQFSDIVVHRPPQPGLL